MSQNKKRILLIDLCRGILVFMMVTRHSITTLEISHQHWLYKYFLPKGWATVCFISLSGFSIGLLYLERMRNPATKRQVSMRLRKRSWQLLVVMFLSNILMLVSKLVVRREIITLLDISWWLGLFTLKTPYSISSILIPTALLVYIAPKILLSIIRYNVRLILGASIVLALVIAAITSNIADSDTMHYLLQRLLFQADGFFPILPMVLYGIISITIGTIWNQHLTQVIITTVIVYYSVTLLHSRSACAQVIFAAISGPARLIIINFACIVLMKLVFMRFLTNFLVTIGHFSLLSFLLHRIFLQALIVIAWIVRRPTSIELVELVFFMIAILNLAGIWVVCVSRLRYPKLNVLFKTLYM